MTIKSANQARLQHLVSQGSLSSDSTIHDAISALDRSEVQLALVLEDKDRLLGLLTDGDVRRAILRGLPLDATIESVYTRDFISVDERAGRAEVLDLMKSRKIRHIPIVGPNSTLKGIHFLEQMLTNSHRPNAVCIMAGGKGTRLLPITRTIPKPMLKVAGLPILERLLLHLIGDGFWRFYISINYLGEQIREYFGDGSKLGCEITYLEESEPLGTAGSLRLIPDCLTDPLLVMNGDLVTPFQPGSMIEAHLACAQELTVATKIYHHQIPYGCLEVQERKVVGFEEKPLLARHINAGIYVVDPQVLKLLPPDQAFHMTELINTLMSLGREVGIYEIHEDWVDIGDKTQLSQANEGV